MTKEYTGGSVSYYRVKITNPTALPAPYEAECNDIIEALKMNFAEGNAFKAIWRKCAARSLGLSKQGYSDGLYDAEKVEFFGHRMVVQEQAARLTDGEATAPGNAQTPPPAVVFAPPPPTPTKWDSVEPAAQIDDESDRQKAVEQNGNDGAVYDDPWYGAPEWATYKAQDADGTWCWFYAAPVPTCDKWVCSDSADPIWKRARQSCNPSPNPDWRDTLISR